MSVEQEIRQLFQARSVALVQKDALTLERLLADEFRYINASGVLLTKADYLHHYVTSSDVRWISQEADDVTVEVYGETAIVTCRVHDRVYFGAELFDATYRSLFVWVRQQESWFCVVGQTTAMAPS